MTATAHIVGADFLLGGGEMGARIRAFDWSSNVLGPPPVWPLNLKTAVRIMLTSRQPMFVWWGTELINLYNDAYKSIVGGKHPQALGQPAAVVWHEIWDLVAPRAESAMRDNVGTYDESLQLIMERYGYREETYYTFSYSPIPTEGSSSGGILCANSDDTQRIIGERQLGLLRELAAQTADARSFEEACRRGAAALRTNPYDLPFAMLYVADLEQRRVDLIEACGIDAGHPVAPATLALEDDALWPFAAVLRAHKPSTVSIEGATQSLPTGAWKEPAQQAVVLPIAPGGRAGRAVFLVSGLNPFRRFDASYAGFIDLVANQIGSGLLNAQAHTDERERAEALAAIDRAKTAFFSNVSHELRTPLTLLLGPLEDLLATAGNRLAAEDRHLLDVMRRNGERLLRLVNTLLDFSRIEAGRVQAVYEPVDLAAYTAALGSMFTSATDKAGLKLSINCPPLPQPVFVDRDMWEKIVLNLVSNAFKYTLRGGIELALRSEADAVVLSVRDSGIGIPAVDLPHIFDRFHRVEGAHGRTHEGTGIGLALVNELSKLHGGSVAVESTVGQGSTFTVRIPFGSRHLPSDRIGHTATTPRSGPSASAFIEEIRGWLPEERAAGAPASASWPMPKATAPAHARPTVLVADDNRDMREYLCRLLADDYDVVAVNNGEEALSAIDARLPDVVLTDVMMPGLDGFGLLKRLRAEARTATVPVIVLSARAGEEAKVEGLAAGADDYLVKPFSAREVVARVAAQVTMKGVRTEALERERSARAEAETLNEIARGLTAELDLHTVLQRVTDAGTALSGATFGAFFYNSVNEEGESYLLFTLSGAPREAFERFGLPRNTAVFEPTFRGEAVLRVDDIQKDPRYGHNAPHYGMPKGHLPVRSYLAVPVIGRSGAVVGGLFFGHPEPGIFTERAERLGLGIAAQAAIAIDNATLYGQAKREIEERIRVEAALQEANRRKDEFLATLAHELRNPLAPLRNGLEILRLAKGNHEAEEQARRIMERQLQQMVRLIDDLLDLSRISRGKVELRKERVDVATVLQNAVEISRPMIEQATQDLVIGVPTETIYVEADVTRLAQVLANLLNNASKYTDKGGRIWLSAERQGAEVVVSVRDNGVGIPGHLLPHVFEMFTQVDKSLSRTQGGLGIGLNIVHRLVEMHGGSVEARSGGQGMGSEFIVRLPVLMSVVGPSTSTSAEDARTPATAKRRILVADDNVDSASSMATMLEILGNEVRTAHDGLEALEVANVFRPDVILLDIGMPGLNGYDVCRRIRAQPWGKDISIIAVTGWGQEDDRRRSQEAGFDHHLVKPVDPTALQKVLAGEQSETG